MRIKTPHDCDPHEEVRDHRPTTTERKRRANRRDEPAGVEIIGPIMRSTAVKKELARTARPIKASAEEPPPACSYSSRDERDGVSR